MQINISRLKRKIFALVDVASEEDLNERRFDWFDRFIIILIILNIIAVILESVNIIYTKGKYFFRSFEIFSVMVFTMEYLLRIWSCTVLDRFSHPIWGRIKFALTPMLMVDLFAILPFYLPIFMHGLDLRILRALRLFRLFRLFKIGRYSKAIKTLGSVIYEKKEELIITLFAVFILLVFASSFMYFFEHEAQPDAFSSIPSAMWWGVATLTTVGYGDVYPVTPIGKFFGAVIALLGIGLFALPAGILASGFAEQIQRERKREIRCPYCGKMFRIDK